MSKRFFINNLDTPLGQEFYKQLVKEDMDEGVHMATYTDDNRVDVPRGFKKILKRYKPKLSRKKMLEECDVYVYDLHYCDQKDIEYVSSIFGNPQLQLDDQKVLILISNVMVWSQTQLKEKVEEVEKPIEGEEGQLQEKENQEGDESKVIEPLKEEEQQQEGDENNHKVVVVTKDPVYVAYEESDYKLRVPREAYQAMKDLEDKVLGLQRENLRVIVVCSGLWYGRGENIFKQHFKSAWLQDPIELPYLGLGDNKIPTIHISDLIRLVIKVAESPCEQPYVFGIDNTPDKRQSSIVRGISNGVGSGMVSSVESTPLITDVDYFNLDIDMKPSPLVVGSEESPSDFEWFCEKGIANHTRKILEEFWKAHQLRPIKIQIMCPQKQELKFKEISTMISQHYKIPIINYNDILGQALQQWNGELLEDLVDHQSRIQDYLNGDRAPTILDESIKLFYMAIKWRLNQNDCTNRGFILDNFPRFYEECDMIFYPNQQKLKRKKKPKKKVVIQIAIEVEQEQKEIVQEEGDIDPEVQQEQVELIPESTQLGIPQQEQVQEEQPQEEEPEEQEEVIEENEEEGGPKQESFFPESVILLKSLVKNNKQQIPQRLLEFFTDRSIEVQMLDSQNKELYEVFENLRLYIERQGRPFNYLQPEEELIQQHNSHYQNINKEFEESKQILRDKLLLEQKVKYQKRCDIAEKQIQYILDNEQELEQIKNFPFRNYLMDFVVPILNEGLVEVAAILPDDPVEFLSEYLYKKSFEVDKE